MKAIILAAGYATRLYPLTLNQPKALLEVGGKAIIDYIVEKINTVDVVDKIIVVTNNKFYESFDNWAKKSNSKISIKVLNDGTTTEDNRKGAIGDILYTLQEENIVSEDVMIIAGDNLFTFELSDYYRFYEKIGKDCVCVKEIDDMNTLKAFAVAELDDKGKVISLVEKPEKPASNIGVYASYIYKAETLPLFKQYINEGNKPDAPGYFVQWLYKKKDVYAYKMEGECYDIGTKKSYDEVRKIFRNCLG